MVPAQWGQPPLAIRADASGYNQTRTTPPDPFSKICCQFAVVPEPVFQTGMHGAHQNAVLQALAANVQGRKNGGIAMGHFSCNRLRIYLYCIA